MVQSSKARVEKLFEEQDETFTKEDVTATLNIADYAGKERRLDIEYLLNQQGNNLFSRFAKKVGIEFAGEVILSLNNGLDYLKGKLNKLDFFKEGKFIGQERVRTARGFWPEHIVEDGNDNETPKSETLSGGAGCWGYQMKIKPVLITEMVSPSNDNHIIQALEKTAARNNNSAQRILEIEKAYKPGTVNFSYEDRLKPKYIDQWLNILAKRRHIESDNNIYITDIQNNTNLKLFAKEERFHPKNLSIWLDAVSKRRSLDTDREKEFFNASLDTKTKLLEQSGLTDFKFEDRYKPENILKWLLIIDREYEKKSLSSEIFDNANKKKNLKYSYEERLNDENVLNWLSQVARFHYNEKHEKLVGKAVKELEIGVGKKENGIDTRYRDTTQFSQIIMSKEDNPDRDTKFILEVVDRKDLAKRRELDKLAENRHIGKVILIREGIHITGMEMWFNHYNSNEENGREYFEEILKSDLIQPEELPEELEIIRETDLKNLGTQIDVVSPFIVNKDIHKIVTKTIASFGKKESEEKNSMLTLSSLYGLTDMLLNDDQSSTYICVSTNPLIEDASGELQVVLAPRPEGLDYKELAYIQSKLLDGDLNPAVISRIRKFGESIREFNISINEDIYRSKNLGRSKLSLMATYLPNTIKKIMGSIFSRTNVAIQKSPTQQSIIPEGSEKFKYARFITAMASSNRSVNSSKKTTKGREVCQRFRLPKNGFLDISDDEGEALFMPKLESYANNQRIRFQERLVLLATILDIYTDLHPETPILNT